MNENDEFEFRYRYEQEQAAQRPSRTETPVTDKAELQREVLAEMPWTQRQLVSAGGQLASAWEGLKSLVPGVEADSDVTEAAKIAAQEAPVGAFVGQVAKFAPAALAPVSIPAQMAAAGAIGAATAPENRAGEGMFEAAGAGIGGAIAKGVLNVAGGGSLDRARKALSQILGPQEADAARLAKEALASGRPMSAIQATADLENPTLVALGEAMKGAGRGEAAAQSASYYRNLEAIQRAAQEAELAALARGATSEEAAIARQAMRQRLEKALGPVRETELQAANTAAEVAARLQPQIGQRTAAEISALQQQGRMATEAAQQQALAQGTRAESDQLIRNLPEGAFPRDPSLVQPSGLPAGAYPVPRMPRVPPRYAPNVGPADQFAQAATEMGLVKGQRQVEKEFLQRQLDSLDAHGLRVIDPSVITSRISAMLQSPKIGVSDVNQKVLGKVADKIREWTRNGTIDANALYQVRKETINETIDDLMRGVDPKASRQVAAKLTAQIRPMIDDVIENAGGTEWKKYITKYAKGLEAIDRVELLDVARNLHRTNPKAFVDLVKGESPEVVQKIMAGKAGVKDALSPATMRKLESVAGQVQRDAKLADMATDPAGKRALAEIIGSQSFSSKLPPLLNRYAVIANTAIKAGEMKVNRGMFKELEKAMRDPYAFLKLIERLPPEQRSKMIGAIAEATEMGIPQMISAASTGTMVQQ